MNRLFTGFCLAYAGCMVIVWMFLWSTTDHWWGTTLFAFGPRWILLIPLSIAFVWALLGYHGQLERRKVPLVSIGLSALIVALPIMGLHWRWPRADHDPGLVRLRVLTCNVAGESAQLPAFQQLVRDRQPQLIALQECTAISVKDWPGDWHVHRAGSLVLASSHPLRDVRFRERRYPPLRWLPVHAIRAVLDLPEGPITVCCVHLRSPRHAITPMLSRVTVIDPRPAAALRMESIYRQMETQEILTWLEDAEGPLLVMGDMNTPPESRILTTWRAQLSDAFASAGKGYGHTKLTPLGPLRYGTRIDYILCSEAVRTRACWVDMDVGSDHFPLLADLEWDRASGGIELSQFKVDPRVFAGPSRPATLGMSPFKDMFDLQRIQ